MQSGWASEASGRAARSGGIRNDCLQECIHPPDGSGLVFVAADFEQIELRVLAHLAGDTALITAPEARDPELLEKLDAIAGRVLRS